MEPAREQARPSDMMVAPRGAVALVVGLAVVAAVLSGCGSESGSGVGAASSNAPASPQVTHKQVSNWRLTADHVSSARWQNIDESPGPSPSVGFTVYSTGLITMTVSATLSGAPVQIRWLDNGTIKSPSFVSFTPTGNRSAFSYTFADTGRAQTCGHTLSLQWRSPTKGAVSLQQGDAVINYQAESGAKKCVHG